MGQYDEGAPNDIYLDEDFKNVRFNKGDKMKKDCKHFDEYIKRDYGCADWCLLHDCTNCDDCREYEKENK